VVADKKPKRSKAAKPAAQDSSPLAANGAHEQPGAPREHFGRTIAPNQIDNPEKRRQWGLPPIDTPQARGFYIVELNVQYSGGLSAAEHEFRERFRAAMAQAAVSAANGVVNGAAPLRISKSYFRCSMTDAEWKQLVENDERRPDTDRVIYKLWPDFPVRPQTDRSVNTVKADAAMRAFNAAGAGIVWAVIDSGVDAAHLHFGSQDKSSQHLLLHPDVADLHRCFADIALENGNVVHSDSQPASPDWNLDMAEKDRRLLVDLHRTLALRDEYGHGTHVAGIISGRAPAQGLQVLERQYKLDPDGHKIKESYGVRSLESERELRGVAPQCKLISLRILDDEGEGRASHVIQALEYLREKINDNPKLMRVHGVNLSIGYEFDAEMFAAGQSPICTEVDRLVQSGVVVVAAAGNTGYGTVAASARAANIGLASSINDPGNAAGAITVGSTHRDSPHTYGISYFSSKGPTGDGRIKPDLVAPGERITSCATGKKLSKAIARLNGAAGPQPANYIDDSGTSMAAPHVSGAIAAFLSVRREFIGKPLEVKKIMADSATDLHRERYFQGSGLIDLMRALQSV
jgi:subtilisin family serine protease